MKKYFRPVMRFASVDIGSNAVRLLFSEVYVIKKKPLLKKITLIRLPIRLGEDAFSKGEISAPLCLKLEQTFFAFKNLCDVYGVVANRVCATSAMRDAANGNEIIARIKKQTGIQIEIIDGKKEAGLIYATSVAESIDEKGCYLYVDVGGGSTEITLFNNGNMEDSASFNVGSVRLKNNLVLPAVIDEMLDFIEALKNKYQPELIIATGGNINKIYKMCGLKDYALLSTKQLKETRQYLQQFTLEERIEKLGMREDRADVIIPACDIYYTVAKAAGIKNFFIPKLGLADGIIHQLWREYTEAEKLPAR